MATLNNAGVIFGIRTRGGVVGRVSCRRAVYDAKVGKMIPQKILTHVEESAQYEDGYANALNMVNITMAQLMQKGWDKPAMILVNEQVANRYFSAIKKINAEIRDGAAPQELDYEKIANDLMLDWMSDSFKEEFNLMVQLIGENYCRERPVDIGVMRTNNLKYMELDMSNYMGELKHGAKITLTNSVYEDENGEVKVRDNNRTTGEYDVSVVTNGETARYYVVRKIEKNITFQNVLRMFEELDKQLPSNDFEVAEEEAVAVGADEF